MDHPKTTPEPFFNKGRHAQHPYFQIPESTTQRIFFSAAPEDFEATALVNGLTQMATSVGNGGLTGCIKLGKLHLRILGLTQFVVYVILCIYMAQLQLRFKNGKR